MKEPILTRDTIQKVAWIVIGSMVLIQVFAYLLNQIFGVGSNVRLGTGFMLIIIAGIVMFSFILLMRAQRKDPQLSKINLVIMLIAVAALIFLLLNMKAWVPEIFTEAVYDLQSIFGMI